MTTLQEAIAGLRAAIADEYNATMALQADVAKRVTAVQDLALRAVQAAALADTPPDPTPDPTPDPVPAAANTVRIGTATYPLSAVNPTPASNPDGAPYGGCRGPDQLVAYEAPVERSGTNAYGTEVEVSPSGAVGTVSVGRDGGISVPAGGRVLSGHGRASTWLQSNCRPGVRVELVHLDEPAPGPSPAPSGGRTLAVYLMDKVGHVSQVPDNITQIRIAFLQGTQLAEWGGDSPAQTAADLRAWKAARPGRQVLVSIGGAGGAVNLGGLVGAVRAIERTIPLDGIDWDVESASLDVARAVDVSRQLAAGRETAWLTTFTPSGGPPVAVYLEAAKRCQAAGMPVQFSQQLYDTRIVQSDVIRQTGLAVDVLGQESVLVGCMVGSDPSRYSTVDQWETYIKAAAQQWPKLGGSMLWESSRAGTAEWAARVGAVLGL